MTDAVESLLLGLCLVAITLCLLLWGMGIGRVKRGQPLISWAPRRQVPWNLLDLIVVLLIALQLAIVPPMVIAFLYQSSVSDVTESGIDGPYRIPMLIGYSLVQMATLLFGLLFLRFRSGATSRDLGFAPFKLGEDALLSLTSFIMLVVPTLLIQFLALKALQTDEQHPFVDMFQQNPNVGVLITIAFAAVIVAPIVEEFLFRVLLQGWLERAFAGLRRRLEVERVEESSLPADRAGLESSAAEAVPVAERAEPEWEDETASTRTQWAPIIISGVIFGLVHYGHGPAPIALSFLGIGLGYLFHRTHRVWPCILVHALVNLLAVVQLVIHVSTSTPQ